MDEILAVESPLSPGEGQGEGKGLWGLADHEDTIRDVVAHSLPNAVDDAVARWKFNETSGTNASDASG